MKKRLLAGLLALTLVFSGSMTVAAAESTVVTTISSDGETVVETEILEEKTETEVTEGTEAEVTEEETTEVTEAEVKEETTGEVQTEEVTEETTGEDEIEVTENAAAVSEAVIAPVEAEATVAAEGENALEPVYGLNPIYASEYSVDDLKAYMAQQEDESGTVKKFDAGTYTVGSLDEAAAVMKNALKARNTACTITMPIYENPNTDYELIFQKAMADTAATAPNEGDYLRANWYGFALVEGSSYTNTKVTYVFSLSYVDDAEKEATVTAMIPSVLNSLNLTGKTNYEKVKIIHDYICKKITYTTDGSSLVYHSTYGALVNGKSVCQGYASLFYRLCKESGIPVRFITGTGGNEAHAWNIVKLGNYYYNLDATWADSDDSYDTIYYNYFLRSENDFGNHTRINDERDGLDYTSAAFHATYPMAPTYYGAMVEMNVANLSKTFTTVDGTKATTVAAGKPKLLVFVDAKDSTYCGPTISAIAQSKYVTGATVDVVAVDVESNSLDTVNAFKAAYGGGSAIAFCYDTGYDAYTACVEYDDTYGTGMIAPMIYYVDAKGMVRAMTYGKQTTSSIDNIITKMVTPSTGGNDGGTFGDVPAGAWYADAVNWAYTNGVMSGTGNNNFNPMGNTDRSMVVQILYNIAGKPAVGTAPSFSDVSPNAWYAKAIQWAASTGVTKGVSATQFAPERSVTRQEVAVFLYQYAKKNGLNTSGRNDLSGYSDSNQVASWAMEAMQWANNSGIINGKGSVNPKLDPQGTATRAEIATMMRGFMTKYY